MILQTLVSVAVAELASRKKEVLALAAWVESVWSALAVWAALGAFRIATRAVPPLGRGAENENKSREVKCSFLRKKLVGKGLKRTTDFSRGRLAEKYTSG